MSIVAYTKPVSNRVSSRSGFEDFEKIFDNLFRNTLTNLSAPTPSVTDLRVDLDIQETNKAYLIHADLPGVKEEDVDIELSEGVLSIFGEKKILETSQDKTSHRTERSYGSFKRALQLPSDAIEDRIKARMSDGVLEIEIKKHKEPTQKKKKIEIKN